MAQWGLWSPPGIQLGLMYARVFKNKVSRHQQTSYVEVAKVIVVNASCFVPLVRTDALAHNEGAAAALSTFCFDSLKKNIFIFLDLFSCVGSVKKLSRHSIILNLVCKTHVKYS